MYSHKLDDDKHSALLTEILKNLKNRDDLNGNDKDITTHWFSNDIAEQKPHTNQYKRQKLNNKALLEEEERYKTYKQDGIKILAMEFMDGYITLKKYLEETKINNEVLKQ